MQLEVTVAAAAAGFHGDSSLATELSNANWNDDEWEIRLEHCLLLKYKPCFVKTD